MFEIDPIPSVVTEYLRTQPCGEVLFSARADRDEEMRRAEACLLVTRDELRILRIGDDGSIEEEIYPILELHGYRVEELLSGGRLTAKRREGEDAVLLAAFTNFCKDSMFLFAKYAEQVSEGKDPEPDPKDDPAEKRCPKCGMRYPDLNRKICPRCMERGKLFRRFSEFLLRYRGYLILLLLSLILLTGMSILAPYFSSGFFYDEVVYGSGKFAGQILTVLFLVIGTRVLKTLASIVNGYVSARIASKMVFDLKKTIFGAIERLSLGFFTGRQTGGLMTQVNEDATTIYEFFCEGIPYFVISIVQILVLTVLLFLMEPLLALLTLLTVPVFLLLIRWMFRRERLLHSRRYAGSRQMNSFLSDVFSGMRIVKAFSKEQVEIRRFTGKSRRLAESEKKLSLFTNYAWPLAGLTLFLGNIVAWGVGGWMVIKGYGGMTYGTLLTFIAYINMVYEPLDFFTDFVDWGADCSNALQRLYEIMDAQPDVSEKENPERPDPLGGSICFDHVSFSYQKGKKVIDDVSFSVPECGILGIVGHTGAGKSTIANLLMRMYDVEAGEIRVGGYPIRDLALSTLYRNIAIVSQETYLFMGTILENIRYAKPEATEEEVIAAAKCAGAHDFIMHFPDGYHTRIGYGNQDLSGGERQRVSIARAILKNPSILILDEATAAMDTGTERKIQEALTELIKGKTTIMIAHRLSTLRDADQLVVIEHGTVAESGTHTELLSRENGVYKKLFTLQEEALKSAGISE